MTCEFFVHSRDILFSQVKLDLSLTYPGIADQKVKGKES